MNWLDALVAARDRREPVVLITILTVEGSAPRGAGTRMVVSMDTMSGTIGGGALEQMAIDEARTRLRTPEHPLMSETTYHLGQDLAQCCGGRVTVQFDIQRPVTLCIELFGAGYVGHEVARLAQRLPCRLRVHDARPNWLERLPTVAPDDSGTVQLCTLGENAFAAVEACEPDACYLIMTHSHELDFELVEAVLTRADSRYCGLIASKSKASSFRSRLQRKGFTANELQQLTAPIGKEVQTGNAPMEVAIAALADILSVINSRQGARGICVGDRAKALQKRTAD